MPTPRILRVVCRGTVDLDIKNEYYKVISFYIESLSRLGAIPRCNPTTLSTRNLDRLKASFEEDIVSDLSEENARKCRVQLEVLHFLYRGLELFELQGARVAGQFFSDIVDGEKTQPGVRLEFIQNEKFTRIQEEFARIGENHEAFNDSMTKSKITKLADILEKLVLESVTVQKVLIVVPAAKVCEEVNKMLAGVSNLVRSYPYDTTKYSKQTHEKFIQSDDRCIVVISSSRNLEGQHISLIGISVAICLDVPKTVLRKPPRWPGSLYMLLTDAENKSFQADSILENSPRGPSSTSNKGLVKQVSRRKKAFLTKEDQKYFDRHFKCSTKIKLPSARPEAPTRSQLSNTVQLSLTRWRPWQNKLQETYQIGHSLDTQILVDVFSFCDDVADSFKLAGDGSCRNDVALPLCPEVSHLCEGRNSLLGSSSKHNSLVDFLDLEAINALAISPELDRYVLDNATKIRDYLSELGLGSEEASLLQNLSSKHSSLTLDVSQNKEADPEIIYIDGSPEKRENEKEKHAMNKFIRNCASPLAITGSLPETSTPFSDRGPPPRADFKMTPVIRRRHMTPTTRKRSSVELFEPSTHGSTRLCLTDLVNVVQQRRKQKNLQYFFNDQRSHEAELSAIAEVGKESSQETLRETCSKDDGPNANRRDTPFSSEAKAKLDFESADLISVASGSKHIDYVTEQAKAIVGTKRQSVKTGSQKKTGSFLEYCASPRHNRKANKSHDSANYVIEEVDDYSEDDSIFAKIDIDCLAPAKLKPEKSALVEQPGKDIPVEQRNDHLKESSALIYHVEPLESPQTAKPQPKQAVRSIFDAIDNVKSRVDCGATNDALLNIIKNIPTRSKEAAESVSNEEFQNVGNIFTKEFHDEIKRSSDTDGDSDGLFDLIEEPLAVQKESSETDAILQKLLQKADERSWKNSVESLASKQETSTPKGFRKQKLESLVEIKGDLERSSCVESLKASFKESSTSKAMTASGRIPNHYASQAERSVASSIDGSTQAKTGNIFKENPSKILKRARQSSGSSDELTTDRRRRKKPFVPDETASQKGGGDNFFDDEAEVDSLESVSEDEDDREDTYEMNSFVDDETGYAQSQGMYRRLNKDLSPRQKARQPRKHVPYEDCFSQPPSEKEDDSYGSDSFIDTEPVADITLPSEITICHEIPEPKRKQKKKTVRIALICEDSSIDGHDSSDRKSPTKPVTKPNRKEESKSPETHLVKLASLDIKSTEINKGLENVILVNTELLEILPEILVGLHRTFTDYHIEPVEMASLENHPVDLYLGTLCTQIVALDRLSSCETEVRCRLERLISACESPVFLLFTPNNNNTPPEHVYRAILEISEMKVRMFFVKGQVELLMLLKCMLEQPTDDHCLMQFLESDDLRLLLKVSQLNIRTASALLNEKDGKAQNVMKTSSVPEIKSICRVSEQFARAIHAALRTH